MYGWQQVIYGLRIGIVTYIKMGTTQFDMKFGETITRVL